MKIFKNFLTLMLGVSLAIVAGELGLKLFWHPDILNNAYLRDDLSWIQKNVRLSAYGYRDDEIELKKDPTKLRVYSLGDSFTYGWYINDQNLAYPNQAEKILNLKNFPVEIINASQPGFKPKDSLERFKNEGITMAPDIVTLGVNIYDLTSREFAPHYTKNKFLKKSRLYQLTFGNLERWSVAAKTETELQNSIADNSDNLQKFIQTINEFKKLTSSTGAKFVLIIFPNYDPANPNLTYGYTLFHRQVKKVADIEGVDIVDLFEPYSMVQDKRQLVLNPLDDHPSILAHQIAAEELIKYLQKNVSTYKPISQNILTASFKVGESIPDKSIVISLGNTSGKWVYFDLANGLDVQKKVLADKTFRKLDYLVDYLKTAKSLMHEGWPGAKIEYNVLGGEQVKVPLNLYGYTVFGVNQLTGYWREDSYQRSRDIDSADLKVVRNKDSLIVDVKGGNQFDLYRVGLDINVSQINVDERKLLSLTKTKTLSGVTKRKEELFFPVNPPASFAKYTNQGNTRDYYWIDNTVVFGTLKKTKDKISVDSISQDDASVEISVMQEVDAGNQHFNVEYLVY